MDTCTFEQNTSAGIESQDGPQSLYNVLDSRCPCFHWLDALFWDKANVTSLFEFDYSQLDADPTLFPCEETDEENNSVSAPVPMEESWDVDNDNHNMSCLGSQQDVSGLGSQQDILGNPSAPTNESVRSPEIRWSCVSISVN